jgi:hypothetical protein
MNKLGVQKKESGGDEQITYYVNGRVPLFAMVFLELCKGKQNTQQIWILTPILWRDLGYSF